MSSVVLSPGDLEASDCDVLDIGIDVNENFGTEYIEAENVPIESEMIIGISQLSENVTDVSIPASEPDTPSVKDSCREERIIQQGLCFNFVSKGKCLVNEVHGRECPFSHDLTRGNVLRYLEHLCTCKNLDKAISLVTNIAKEDSPLHKYIFTNWGERIMDVIIPHLLQENRLDNALHMLANLGLPCKATLCDTALEHSISTKNTAAVVIRLYQRIADQRIPVVAKSWDKMSLLLTNVAEWKHGCGCVSAAARCLPSYEPHPDVLDFLVRDALNSEMRLTSVCQMLKGIDTHALQMLSKERKQEILRALDSFGFRDLYNYYLELLIPPAAALSPIDTSPSQFVPHIMNAVIQPSPARPLIAPSTLNMKVPQVAAVPNVIVEPTFATRQRLESLLTSKDYQGVSNLLLSFYSYPGNCPMVRDLILLIRQDRIETPAVHALRIVNSALEHADPRSLPANHIQALLDLSVGIIHHLFEDKNFEDTYLLMSALFMYELPLIEFMQQHYMHPSVLVFVADSFLRKKQFDVALRFLTEFHKRAHAFEIEDELYEAEGHLFHEIIVTGCNDDIDFGITANDLEEYQIAAQLTKERLGESSEQTEG